MPPKRVFISYAWEDAAYRQWVVALATRLREDGVDARLDEWHLEEGGSIPEFMNREIRQAEVVLLLCSPGYRAKVHQTEEGGRVAGVGWEARLVTGRLLANHRGLTIPVLTRGRWEDSAPDFLATDLYCDLSDPDTFETSYSRLLDRLTGTGPRVPELGAPPRARPEERTKALRGGDLSLGFRLLREGEGFRVELRINGDAALTAPFDLDLTSAESQARRDAEAIESGRCTTDDIQNLGSELWAKLLSGDLERRFTEARRQLRGREGAVLKVRLTLPPELEALPWEALLDMDEGALATSPIASVARDPFACSDNVPPLGQSGPARPLKMLVIIPSGSGLGTSSEWEKIQQTLRAAKDIIVVECLDGRVTVDALAEKLRDNWDVVHYIGHGRLEHERVEIRLNRESGAGNGSDEQWIPASLFAQQFRRHPPRLVVLNCCHGGALDPRHLGSLGSYLMRVKVPSVVVMRYAIQDSVAADSAGAFYRELIAGERAGRVDLAVQEGRAALARNCSDSDRARAYITPHLYLWAGFERLFDLEAAPGSTPQVSLSIDPRIDARLVDAIRAGACVPILGAEVLAAGAIRGREPAPGPAQLARQLAEKSGFPGFDRVIPLTDSTAAWLTPVLFERVCQHFESVSPGERRELNVLVQEAYRSSEAPEVLEQIATWRYPGLVYCYVDGLLEAVLNHRRGRELRVTQAEELDEAASARRDEIVLLNLRGTYTHPQSMILTESDEERILDGMGSVARLVEDLMNRVGGCTLLFLGVSPRDSLVRALGRRLLRKEVARRRGTAFFACDHLTNADRSYWSQFEKLEVLDIDNLTLVQGLTLAARKPEA